MLLNNVSFLMKKLWTSIIKLQQRFF